MDKEREWNAGNNDYDIITYTLMGAKICGDHIYCVVDGHEFHSDNVTKDSLYLEFYGRTKEQFDEDSKRREEEFKRRKQEKLERQQMRIRKLELSRTYDKKPITLETVINGLKFILEHQSMSYDEIFDKLLELGCNFSAEDIEKQFPNEDAKIALCKNLASAALTVATMRDNEYAMEAYRDIDDFDDSMYDFIRKATGDENYTKENIDSLNGTAKKHM